MFIEHIAIWCNDLEKTKAFYCTWFNASANARYFNPTKQFSSYFLSFDKAPRLELMQMPGIPVNANNVLEQYTGLIHFAVSVGSAEEVNRLTEAMRAAGITVLGEPRFTGDGYYESIVADPEGNRIEITV
jgi:lactoylglutathione lyase